MPSKRKKGTVTIKGVRKKLNQTLVKQLAEESVKYLEEAFDLTVGNWGGGGDSGYSPVYEPPILRREIVYKAKNTLRFSVKASVVDSSGQPHKLYMWLDKGTKPHIMPVNSAVFPRRNRQRYFRSGIDKSANWQFTGERFMIKKGKVKRGIEAQNLTGLMRDYVRDKVGNRRVSVVFTYKN